MEVVSVDVTGEVAAVKVADLYRGMRYIDYLTLLKIDGCWQIVNKTFHQELKA
jgi:protease I